MWPFLVAIVAILAWAFTRIVQSGSETGAEWVKAHGGEELEALKKQVAALTADRQRLTQRRLQQPRRPHERQPHE